MSKFLQIWEKFLKLEQNKARPFHVLVERIGSVETEGKQLCTTLEKNIVCVTHINNAHDFIRMILHTLHCAKEGYDRVIIKTVDTEVAYLAVAAFQSIPMLKGLCIDFGVNKHHRYISPYGIAKALGKLKAEALPVFHAFTECDTVSSFNGIGRKKAWETWKVLLSLTKTFQKLAKCPDLLNFAADEAERFVVILYSRASECKFVN